MRRGTRTPLYELWEWQLHAACRGMASSVFYTRSGERGARRRGREQRARQVCQSCPVQQQCAEFALATKESYGVWGGLTETERAARLGLRPKHPTAAPPPERGVRRSGTGGDGRASR
ncbi:WhiB family transcriptional regulator [Streptomyces sp. SAI-229]|uniref:WhiB family transcriptional regulator n=1 Tax=Streptomyces sp. SAI-229 TaxID=3377731 RepID=UPI003C7DD57E